MDNKTKLFRLWVAYASILSLARGINLEQQFVNSIDLVICEVGCVIGLEFTRENRN